MNHETTRVTTDDGVALSVTVYTAAASAAPPAGVRDVLLVHGWPNAGRVWERLAATMTAAAAYRLVAPDLRGYGLSYGTQDGSLVRTGYTCARFAADILAVADALGLTGWALVGHSMGGKVAQVAAARNPAGLSALALVTPAPLPAPPPADMSARRALKSDPKGVYEMLTGWAARPLPRDVAAGLVAQALAASPLAWDGWLAPMRNEDHAADAARIAVPTLVIGGGRDGQRTEEELRSGVVGVIAGARYASLPNVGHLPHLEEPDAVAALLVNFLDAVPVPGGKGARP